MAAKSNYHLTSGIEIRLILDETKISKMPPFCTMVAIDCMSTIEQWSSTNTPNAKIIFGITAFFWYTLRHLDPLLINTFTAVLTLPPQCTDILLEGQQQGDYRLMGVYELMEGKEVNGRGVWQRAGGQEYFMYYDGNEQWFICSGREAMEAGEAAGAMRVASTALTPDQATETWQVAPGDGKWYDAPKVRARRA
jgi:hypothetical protein